MIIPSFSTSSSSTSNVNDRLPSYFAQPKINFLNSETSTDTISLVINSETKTHQKSISFTDNKVTDDYKNLFLPANPECKNVLISDFNTIDNENNNIQIKKNKYHNLIFHDNPVDPIKVEMNNILQQINKDDCQSCFITLENNKKTNSFIIPSIITLNRYPEITATQIDNHQINQKDDGQNNSMKQKKEQLQQFLMIQSSIRLPKDGFDQSLNKENKPIKPRQNFTEEQRTILNGYLKSHCHNPYADSADIARLVELTGLQPRQIRTYFTNKRMRDAKCMNLATSKRCRTLISAKKIFP